MTTQDFDRFDRRNDPDLQDPTRCRHRDGDPDCMCHPEEETPEPEIHEDQFGRDLIAFRCLMASAYYSIPRWKTPENHISNAEMRGDVDALFERFQADLAEVKAKWLTRVQG